jgi:hypothetical protein
MTIEADTVVAQHPKRRLRRAFGFDEVGILLAVVLFFILGALSSPYFLTINNLAGRASPASASSPSVSG